VFTNGLFCLARNYFLRPRDMDSSPRKTALFGLVTPMIGGGGDDEEVFVPPSVSRQAAMSPPYSPYPIHEVQEDESGASELVLPDIVDVDRPSRPPDRKRKRSRPGSGMKKRRTTHAPSVIVREVKKRNDPYYSDRFKSAVSIDDTLRSILDFQGPNFFHNKNVCINRCGGGFIAFYIAAFLSPAHVVALDRDIEIILRNCMQLRKFKHDGIPVDSEPREDDYPKLCVRRCGVVPVTNKTWIVEDQYRCSHQSNNFPFNIEFRSGWKFHDPPKIDILIDFSDDPLSAGTNAEHVFVIGRRPRTPEGYTLTKKIIVKPGCYMYSKIKS
jgi:hypothetical protein